MSQTGNRTTKPNIIARELGKRIQSDKGYDPPAINQLADVYNVSYLTMWKAVRLLVSKGLLVTSPPKKIAVAPRIRGGKQADSPSCHIRSADHLEEEIRSRIEKGIYKVGQPLPKTDYFARTEKVSPDTISRTMRRLSGANLLHKKRRRWFVGPGPLRAEHSPKKKESQVALLLLSDTTAWPGLFQHTFNEMFMSPLKSELAAHAVELSPVVWNKSEAPAMVVPSGLGEIKERIRELGKCYAGVFAFTTFPREHRVEEWIDGLCPLKKPVIYFDPVDAGGYIRRNAQRPRGAYFRLHLDERSACLLALRELARNGHEVIAIHGHARADWTQRRTRLLQTLAPEGSPKMKIVLSGEEEPFWDPLNNVPRPNLFQAGPGKPGGIVAPHELRAQTPSMTELLCRHRPTAFIGLADGLTTEYYFWFKAAGISVPRDISMISFDNMTQSIFIPVSTIDFGLARLGYLAAHLLIGDIPMRADRYGFVPGPCELVDRGSVCPPPSRTIADMLDGEAPSVHRHN